VGARAFLSELPIFFSISALYLFSKFAQAVVLFAAIIGSNDRGTVEFLRPRLLVAEVQTMREKIA
jgi:hypothetical protein